MDVIMHSIMAGPDGCADAGQSITLSPKAGKQLVDGGYAEKVPAAKREKAMIDPQRQAQIDAEREKARENEAAAREAQSKTPEALGQALDSLDPTDDEDWTANGKPAMGRVKELTGSTTITRADLDAVYPDFTRAGPSGGGEKTSAPNDGESGEPAPAPASGARTNGL